MSEEVEVQEPVVQEVEKEEVSPLAEETTPKQESQAESEDTPDEGVKTIPKDRFDQVWARSKKAEAKLAELDAQLRQEREERIRLEERSKVQQEQAQQAEYTWDQLENFIAEGKLTRGQAQEYKDKMTEQRLERKFKQQQVVESKDSRILGEIEQYKQLIPEVMSYGSESRQKYEKEFSYMTRTLGMPDNYATQLAATRAAFGDVETVKQRLASRKVTPKEPLMETHTPQKQKASSRSFEDTLPQYKRDYYTRMIKSGVVKDWKDAEEIEKHRGS